MLEEYVQSLAPWGCRYTAVLVGQQVFTHTFGGNDNDDDDQANCSGLEQGRSDG